MRSEGEPKNHQVDEKSNQGARRRWRPGPLAERRNVATATPPAGRAPRAPVDSHDRERWRPDLVVRDGARCRDGWMMASIDVVPAETAGVPCLRCRADRTGRTSAAAAAARPAAGSYCNPHRRVIMAAEAARAHARHGKAKQSKRGDWRLTRWVGIKLPRCPRRRPQARLALC